MAPLTLPRPCESHSADPILSWDLCDQPPEGTGSLKVHTATGQPPEGTGNLKVSLHFGTRRWAWPTQFTAALVPSDAAVEGPQNHGTKIPQAS